MTAGASALLVLIGGGTAGIAVATDDEAVVTAVAPVAGPAAAVLPAAPGGAQPRPPAGAGVGVGVGVEDDTTRPDRRTSDTADRTATRAPRPPASHAPRAAGVAVLPAATAKPPVPPAAPVVTTRTVVETRAIPYRTRLVRDPSLPRGSKRLQTPGVPGEETLRYLVTFTDGQETGRRLVGTEVTRAPQDRVVAFGSRRGKDGPRDCGPGSDRCRPTGRAICPASPDPAPSANGDPAPLVEDLALLDPQDLDGLELDAALLCR